MRPPGATTRRGGYGLHMTAHDPTVATGTMAFVFTDIAGSTRLWEQQPEAMGAALARHDAILRGAVEAVGGQVVKSTGDGMMAVFPAVAGAVTASIDAQRQLAAEPWPETGPIRIRIGLHAGEAERRGDDYFGPTVNRTARLMAAGHGGQVLLSAAAAALAGDRLPDGATLRDLGEYRLKDLGRPERVFQLLHPLLADAFPPLNTLDHVAGGLPVQAAAFIGRQQELGELARRMADPGVRLLTLTGPGGSGKTSLAVRAAADAAAGFRDGVSFVDLSAAGDAEAVLLALARTVGVGEAPGRSLLDDVADRIGDRQVLLLLDNFEQVTAAAAIATQLLAACPELKLLVTSREPLHVRAEHVFEVPPMGVPPSGRRRATVAALAGFEAVELFVDRARGARPAFELDDDNADAVADICRRLDGLPLAIELAAARLRLFSPQALRERLSGPLDLLRSASRDLPERQQTLRATIDWSYRLLEPPEQRLFETLAAFAGADVGAVEAVVARIDEAAGERIDVVEGLASLLEKSLVRQADVAGGEPRLVMLETIRDFAVERLDARPDADRVRRAHAGWYAELAERLRGDLGGPRRDLVVDALGRDADNLRTAWRYWIAERDLGQLTRLVDSLLILNEARGWYRETVELTTGLLEVLAAAPQTQELATQEFALRMSLARALMATRGYTHEVEEAYAQALERIEQVQDARREFSVLRGLANAHLLRARFTESTELGDRLLAIARAEQDVNMEIDALLVQATGLVFTGHLTDGLRCLETAIARFDAGPPRAVGVRLGNEPRVACLTTSAFCLWLSGFPDRAVERANAGIELARRLDHPWTRAYAQFHSGLLHLWRREYAIVRERALGLQELAEEYDFRIWSAISSCLLGVAQTGLGQAEAGLANVREGMAAYQGIVAPPVFWPMLLFVDAIASARAGVPAQAVEPIGSAIGLMGGVDAPGIFVPEMLLLRGDLFAAMDGPASPASAEAYAAALAGARHLGARISELRALTRLARVSAGGERDARRGELASALAALTEGETTLDMVEARAILAD
jgi:predicted ATPase/class 3 adenylate cyclase